MGKALYTKTVQKKGKKSPFDPDLDLDCQLVDPVELMDPHYASTIGVLSSFMSAMPGAGDIAIALTFAVEVGASWGLGASIGGGMGFAIDGHGSGIIFETAYGSLSVSSQPAPDIDANFVVTLGFFKDLSSVEGFAITASVGADLPVFSLDLGASMAEGANGWEVIGIGFAASFDLTGSEYQAGVGVALTAETCTAIASLKSSAAAIAAGGVTSGTCDKDYPMIGPSIDEQYFISGGSSGKALITVSKEVEGAYQLQMDGQCRDGQCSPNEREEFRQASVPKPDLNDSINHRMIAFSLVGVAVAVASYVAGNKLFSKKLASKDEVQPLLFK